mmetsp:Transcript_79175/g.155374  ORF Transcript_79175/g.155374 Transcript_79175/m.155374 type:complete len:201 (-) Transcript_79175:237-839(-)
MSDPVLMKENHRMCSVNSDPSHRRVSSDELVSCLRGRGRTQSHSSFGDLPKRRISWQEDRLEVMSTTAASSYHTSTSNDDDSPCSSARDSPSGAQADSPKRDVSCQLADTLGKIWDQRAVPSTDDHDAIANSFQQGLRSVEAVILLDDLNPPADSFPYEFFGFDGDWGMRPSLFLAELAALCAQACECHRGLALLAAARR